MPSLSFKIALLIFWGILFVTWTLLTNLGSRETIIANASAEKTPCVAKTYIQLAPAVFSACYQKVDARYEQDIYFKENPLLRYW